MEKDFFILEDIMPEADALVTVLRGLTLGGGFAKSKLRGR